MALTENPSLSFKTGLCQPIGGVTLSIFIYSQWFNADLKSILWFFASFVRVIDKKNSPFSHQGFLYCCCCLQWWPGFLSTARQHRLEPLGLLYAGRESRSVVLSASALCHAVALSVTHSNRAADTLRWSALLKKEKNQLTGGKRRPRTLATGTAHLAFRKGLGANALTRLFAVGSLSIFSHLHILFSPLHLLLSQWGGTMEALSHHQVQPMDNITQGWCLLEKVYQNNKKNVLKKWTKHVIISICIKFWTCYCVT